MALTYEVFGRHEVYRLGILATLIDVYEEKHHPIDPLDPVDAILFRLDQLGLSRHDLERFHLSVR